MNDKLYNKIKFNKNWLKVIDSWKDWKVLTIVCCTHWDEIVWLQVFDYLFNKFWIKKRLLNWKINFLIANKQAFLEWMKYIDTDLNRIWDFKKEKQNTYEYRRAKEIIDILKESDYILDLHSTTNPSKSIFIPNSKVDKKLIKKINTDYIIKWILPFFHWTPLINFDYKNKGSKIQTIVIEWWENNWKETLNNSIKNTLTILDYYDFINYKIKDSLNMKETYEILDCFHAKSLDFKFLYSNSPKSFQNLKKGEKVYIDNTVEVIAPYDFTIIMPTNPRYIKEEVWFLAKKIET